MGTIINKEKLKRYANAYIMYELASHGIDPRKGLEGTTLRLMTKAGEGYKYDIYEKYHLKIQHGGPYVDIILDALPGGNLVSYHQKKTIENIITTKGPEQLEQALIKLYESNEEATAFSEIIDAAGANFDVLGFLFFLKDRERYLPIRSQIFDELFALLDVDSKLAGYCNWKKYQEYLSWIIEIRSFLQEHINEEITLIDAHSFLWILSHTAEYLDKKIQLVEHIKFGIGTVVGFEDGDILVQFGKDIKRFTNDSAFEKGILRYLPVDFDIDPPKHPAKVHERSYLVIQGLHSKDEYKNGFLWAPYLDKSGKHVHSWDRMMEIRKGDKIFHYSDGKIRAISLASSTWFDSTRPISYEEPESMEKGRQVDCTPHTLATPLIVSNYRDDIVRYRKDIYSAFNKDGLLNQGYVYELEPEIAALFESEIRTLDPTFTLKTQLSKKGLEVAYAFLLLLADRRRTVTYSQLSEMTESKPKPFRELPKLIGKISSICDELDLPHISAMVINKNTGLPGEGFKELCVTKFGYDSSLTTQEIFEKELDLIGQCDRWNELADYLGLEMPAEHEEPYPEEIPDTKDDPIYEGAKKQITVNAYERDPKARKRCKDYYMKLYGRLTCQICGFDFGKVYGPEYSNKIHFHHKVPISKMNKVYIIDPEKDLIPVCPNCHMVLHANGGIEIEDLKKRLQELQSSK